jgi:toxin ParE1/3/4
MDIVLSIRAGSAIATAIPSSANQNPPAAERLLAQINRRFQELSDFPMLGPERNNLGASLRGLLIRHLIAFYIIEADRIAIVRVLDSRMTLDDDLFN